MVSKAWESKKFRPAVSFQEVEDVKGTRNMSLSEAAQAVERKKSVTHIETGNEKV